MTTEIIGKDGTQANDDGPRLVTDLAAIQAYLPLLVNEFSPTAPDAFRKKLRDALMINGKTVFSNPTSNPRGADMFVLKRGGKVEAVSVSKYYLWDLLKGQLYLKPSISASGEITSFRVRSMGGI